MTKNHRLEQWPTNTFYGSSRTRCDSQRVCGNRFAAKRRKQEGRPVSTPLGSASDAYILHWAICRHLFVSFVPHFPSFLRIPNSFADSNFGTPHTTTHYSELVKTALSSFYSFIINNELVDKVNVRQDPFLIFQTSQQPFSFCRFATLPFNECVILRMDSNPQIDTILLLNYHCGVMRTALSTSSFLLIPYCIINLLIRQVNYWFEFIFPFSIFTAP